MKSIVYVLIFIMVSFVGCSGTTPNSGDREMEDISIIRFDKDIYRFLKQSDNAVEDELNDKYPLLLPAYGRIAMNDNDPATLFASLKEYFSHPMLMQIYEDVLSAYGDVSVFEDELNAVDKLVGEHFANKKMPQMAIHVSGFKENVIILNELISLSADKYLGSNYPAYQDFFQPFERQQMQSQYLVRDFVKAWLISDVLKPSLDKETNLLTAMVDEGKVLHALSVLLPKQSTSNIIGYSQEQTEWCIENEKMIWQNIVKQNHLYSSDHMIVMRYVGDAPNTSTVSARSPGRLGCWVGWQIVDNYMKRKKISFEEIVNVDAQTILKDSKYNP